MVVTPTSKAIFLPNCKNSFGWQLACCLPWQFSQLKIISLGGFAQLNALKPQRLRSMET
jgi:hypothetical protein